MKKLIFIALLIISNIANCQQISELNKGLVFRWEGSEWNPTRDMVSGAQGVATNTYPVAGRSADGANRYLNFNGSSDYVTLPTIPAFGTGDFTILIKCNLKSNTQTLLDGGTNSLNFYIDSDYKISIGKNGVGTAGKSTTVLSINTDYIVGYKRSGTTGYFIINGVAESTTITDSYDYSVTENKLGESGYYPDGSISLVRIFNNSTIDISYYSKPENPIKAADLTACKLNLGAEGLSRASDGSYNTGYWTDRTNSITATVSGATSVIPPASNLNATWFNGTTSNITGYSFTPGNGDFTISLWVNKSTNDGVYFFGGGNSSFAFNTSGNALLVTKVDVVNLTVSSSPIVINTWTMCSYVRSGGIGKYYINGTLINSITDTQNYSVASTLIGKRYNSVAYLTGALSNIQCWNSAFSSDQIKLLYDLGH